MLLLEEASAGIPSSLASDETYSGDYMHMQRVPLQEDDTACGKDGSVESTVAPARANAMCAAQERSGHAPLTLLHRRR